MNEGRNLQERLAGLEDKEGLVEADAHMALVLGDSLRQAREAGGWTQAELAVKLNCAPDQVARIELGKDACDACYVSSLIEACGLPQDWRPGPDDPTNTPQP